jgi:zinc transporter
MATTDGLLSAFVLDGSGGGREVGWPEIRTWKPDDGVLWVHMDRTAERAQEWVEEHSGADAATAETLLRAEGNRPRVERVGDALVVMLRGVNRNQGEDAEDMPTMHMWVTPRLIVSLRRRRLMAGNEIKHALLAGRGPTGPGDFLVQMADRLLDPMTGVFADLDDEIDALHEQVLTAESRDLRRQLREVRQAATLLRRHLAPQREAMTRLQAEPLPWVSSIERAYLREIADRTTRFVEDLDAARERAAITQDELNNRLADQMNRTMYLLTIVSALLLPPSLLTGLFGINVGGMPGVEAKSAFWIVAITIPVLAVIEFAVLRRLKWI